MKESVAGKVIVEDVEPEIMAKVLTYIYMPRDYEYSMETAIEILRVADKYQIEHLKRRCENLLMGFALGDRTSVTILNVAKTYKSDRLQSRVMSYLENRSPRKLASIIEKHGRKGWRSDLKFATR